MLNTIRYIGFLAIAMGFLFMIIIINIRKSKENQFSILLRIFTNYTQLITAVLSFNIKFPASFSDFSSQSGKLSSPEQSLFSFDCFVEDYDIKLFASSNALLKLLLYLILPIALMATISFLLLIFKGITRLAKSEKNYDIRRYLAISFICIIFLFHPTMIFQSLRVFQ